MRIYVIKKNKAGRAGITAWHRVVREILLEKVISDKDQRRLGREMCRYGGEMFCRWRKKAGAKTLSQECVWHDSSMTVGDLKRGRITDKVGEITRAKNERILRKYREIMLLQRNYIITVGMVFLSMTQSREALKKKKDW